MILEGYSFSQEVIANREIFARVLQQIFINTAENKGNYYIKTFGKQGSIVKNYCKVSFDSHSVLATKELLLDTTDIYSAMLENYTSFPVLSVYGNILSNIVELNGKLFISKLVFESDKLYTLIDKILTKNNISAVNYTDFMVRFTGVVYISIENFKFAIHELHSIDNLEEFQILEIGTNIKKPISMYYNMD